MAGDILVMPPVFFIRLACERQAPFVVAGKAVRTGHSGAAVSGYRPPFMSQDLEHSQSGAILVKAEARQAARPPFQISNLKFQMAAVLPETRSPNISLRTHHSRLRVEGRECFIEPMKCRYSFAVPACLPKQTCSS